MDGSLCHLHSPEVDQIFHAVSIRYRRVILLLLSREEVLRETDIMVRNENPIDEVEKDLHDNHLPLLAEAGFIEWNQETGKITKGPRFNEIQPMLELIENHSDKLPPDWP